MKADYVHKDTLTATDYVELNKNNELLMSYNQELLKENQSLKKQLENYKKLGFKHLNDKCNNLETQQKEFISYLENEIYNIVPKGCGINFFPEDGYDSEEDFISAMKEQSRLNTLKEILSKYREIIGGK